MITTIANDSENSISRFRSMITTLPHAVFLMKKSSGKSVWIGISIVATALLASIRAYAIRKSRDNRPSGSVSDLVRRGKLRSGDRRGISLLMTRSWRLLPSRSSFRRGSNSVVKLVHLVILSQSLVRRVTSDGQFSKRYVKYLTKKYLKNHNVRDWLRVIAANKDGNLYELRYFSIAENEGEVED
ncbi:unnamed protein product [Eruca vesicaria subsp. sativa]|uniref:Ribosomal protein L22 n=1 Tax=Eruca vesicaria subsp. sativa TaxID=29727 RepID=A0ABC8M3L2_ERUVS|nr:unnamed protein product [Eruca vesicaria subsp. sativa]